MRLKELIIDPRLTNTTFLISSHDLNHITDICDRIVLLENGKIINDLKGGEGALAELEAYFKA